MQPREAGLHSGIADAAALRELSGFRSWVSRCPAPTPSEACPKSSFGQSSGRRLGVKNKRRGLTVFFITFVVLQYY